MLESINTALITDIVGDVIVVDTKISTSFTSVSLDPMILNLSLTTSGVKQAVLTVLRFYYRSLVQMNEGIWSSMMHQLLALIVIKEPAWNTH